MEHVNDGEKCWLGIRTRELEEFKPCAAGG